MLGRNARAGVGKAFAPLAELLIKLHIGPDLVTWVGTLLTIVSAWYFFIPGRFIVGPWVVTIFVLMDSLDGLVARLTGKSSIWGAFLDSTLDRVADASILGAIALFYAWNAPDSVISRTNTALALICLVLGMLVSYAKARAESLDIECNVGFMERADRLVVILAGTLAAGLFGPVVHVIVFGFLAIAALYTVGQRMHVVYHQEKNA